MITTNIQEFFDNATHDELYSVEETRNSQFNQQFKEVCNRPEFKPFLAGMKFEFITSKDLPFQVIDTHFMSLSSSFMQDPAIIALRLRHGFELITLRRLLSTDHSSTEEHLVWSILAFHTSLSYFGQMLTEERAIILQHAMDWEIKALEFVESGKLFSCTAEETCTFLSIFLEFLLPLQKLDINTNELSLSSISSACALAAPLLKVAHPAERLLTMGGDNRMLVSGETGLNQYGCSPRPRPWAVTFSSCTASSVSYHAFKQVEELRQSLITQSFRNEFVVCFDKAIESLRKQLAEVLKINTLEAEIIFTSSGTDGEFLSLYFALSHNQKKCLNILIAPTEIGSGSLPAAAGLHFNPTTPLGNKVESGSPLEGFPAEQVRIECFPVRRDSGDIVPIKEIDDDLCNMVEQAIINDEAVLIHLLDCSKTGIMAPSVEMVSYLKSKYPDKISVVVDAAQMRLTQDMICQFLEKDFMVLITGSKFFRGPPFSGALIVPKQLLKNIQKQNYLNLPAGFKSYFTLHDFSPRLKYLGNHLSTELNVGLLMRWQAALWEMSAFFAVPDQQKYETLNTFSEATLNSINQMPELELVRAPIRERKNNISQKSWDHVPSVFTYFLNKQDKTDNTSLHFTDEECRKVYSLLNKDISDLLPTIASSKERQTASYQCHTGQPVKIKLVNKEWISGLRIASGARLVSGVCFDPMLGKTPKDRLKSQLNDMQTIMNKLSIIIQYWSHLKE